MSDEVREIVYTATNFIFIAAVLFIAMLFFDLRSDYARAITEDVIAERRVVEANRYKGYDLKEVSGYDVMNAITTYAVDVPVYVTGAYNYIDNTIHTGRLYNLESKVSNPDWFRVSVSADPMSDAQGLQSMYRQDTTYYAILVYDSDAPDILASDMSIITTSGKDSPATTIADKITWLNGKYTSAREGVSYGNQVAGILFICLDVKGAATGLYNQVAIH